MQRAEKILRSANRLSGFVLAIAIALGYYLPNKFVMFPTHTVLLTPLDRFVGLAPVWVWFYIAYYPLLLAAYVHSTGTQAQNVFVGAMLLSALAAFVIFFFFPTAIARELYPWLGPQELSVQMLEFVRRADNSVNCLPSMHVCMSFIAASTFTLICNWRGRAVAWALFVAICYSTMATKQHYFVDLIAGLGLGVTVVAIMLKKHRLLNSALAVRTS